jgi:hypothetical protein
MSAPACPRRGTAVRHAPSTTPFCTAAHTDVVRRHSSSKLPRGDVRDVQRSRASLCRRRVIRQDGFEVVRERTRSRARAHLVAVSPVRRDLPRAPIEVCGGSSRRNRRSSVPFERLVHGSAANRDRVDVQVGRERVVVAGGCRVTEREVTHARPRDMSGVRSIWPGFARLSGNSGGNEMQYTPPDADAAGRVALRAEELHLHFDVHECRIRQHVTGRTDSSGRRRVVSDG